MSWLPKENIGLSKYKSKGGNIKSLENPDLKDCYPLGYTKARKKKKYLCFRSPLKKNCVGRSETYFFFKFHVPSKFLT